jgi:dienelactone hydrolase
MPLRRTLAPTWPLLILFLPAAPVIGQTIPPADVERGQKELTDEIERYLDREAEAADKERQAAWRRDFSSIEAYERSVEPWRQKLWDLLGGEAAYKAAAGPLDAAEELVGDFDTHRAYRLSYAALDDVRGRGILLVPKGTGPFPAMICIHGMQGSPEAVCGLTEKEDYTKRFGLQAVRRGYVVFAPSHVNTVKMRSWLDRKAIEVGQRLQALEQYKLVRLVDYLVARKDVDAKRVGVYGISWGGRSSMNAAALDRRIAACAISGHFNDLAPKMVKPSEHYTAYIQTAEDYAFFPNHFRLCSDADVVSLICPRPVFIEQGRQDRVAYWEISQKAFEPVKQMYEKLGVGDRAVFFVFEGPHEIQGEEAFKFFDRWLKPGA